MARGLFANWKQLLLYFFVDSIGADELSEIYETKNFAQFVKKQNISSENPYFVVDERKIFYFLAVPHLLKDTRNNLFKYKFAFAVKTYIVEFYNKDRNLLLRLATKLTYDHI